MGTSSQPRDPQVVTLNSLLSSQEKLLLSPTSTDAFKSRYERARIRHNFDYTRSLLLTVSSTRQLPKDDVQRKRELVKRLQTRLNELDQLYAQEDGEDEEDCESCDEEEERQALPSKHLPGTTGGLRQRGAATQPPDPRAQATSTSNRYARPLPLSPDDTAGLQSKEKQLASHQQERDTLASDLLNLAAQLKMSARNFGATLEAEKGTLDATVQGLDKGVGGLDGASGKMKQLQRETEGVGWFRRMRLYLEVGGLWLAVILLVFILPKLRF